MTYCIHRVKAVQDSVQNAAGEQIDQAIIKINDGGLDRHKVVHEVRKCCKKVRGLIRLVRPIFDDFPLENKFFSEAARELSYVRDAQSMVECFDELKRHFQDQMERDAFAPIRQELIARRQHIAGDRVGLETKLDEFLTKMHQARRRITQWKIDGDGFSAVQGGLEKTYRRGRKAFAEAYASPSTENFHEWRKQVKYHGYHANLLCSIWPSMMNAWCKAADDLADLLGDDHNLAILQQTLLNEPERFGSRAKLQILVKLINQRQQELQRVARVMGTRIFAEHPKHLRARLGTYWESWKEA